MAIVHSTHPESGTVTIDQVACKHCGFCAGICASGVLSMVDGSVDVNTETPFGCIACGHCMMVCPEACVKVSGRGISPDDLLPMPSPESRATADALAALMQSRRSVRRFTEQEVEPELLDRIVQMASTAPMGIPPWDIGCVVVRGRDKVHELSDQVVQGYEGMLKIFKPWVLTAMRPIMKKSMHEQFKSFIVPLAQALVDSRKAGRDILFYDAPAVLIFHRSPYSDAVDAAIACTYAMLAAESLGLGTTMIGAAPPILARNKSLCRKLGVPESNTPAIALIIGYPATDFKHTIRRHFTNVSTVD
jgi:nitroreductase/Pyruvate/2-oxoacid:ferredoxin oxidoreductase delta subunit